MKRYTTIILNDRYIIDNDLLEDYEEIGYTDSFEKIYVGAGITKLGLLEDYIEGKITLEEVEKKLKEYLEEEKEILKKIRINNF